MTPREAIRRLAARDDRSVYSEICEIEYDADDVAYTLDIWPELVAAGVGLAGGMEDASDDADLDRAFERFRELTTGGEIEEEEWQHASLLLVQATIRAGEHSERVRVKKAVVAEWN